MLTQPLRPNHDDPEDEATDGWWKVAQAFQPVKWLKHRLESLCHTSGPCEIAIIGALRIFRRGATAGVSLFALVSLSSASTPDVKIEFTDTGELSLTLDGQPISQPTKVLDPTVRFRDPAATVPLWGANLPGQKDTWPVEKADLKPQSTSFDPAKRQLTQTFSWGEVVRTYRLVRGGVDIEVTVRNNSPKTLCQFEQRLFTLKMPGETGPAMTTEALYFGQADYARKGDTLSGPVALPLVVRRQGEGNFSRAIVATTPETKRQLKLSWDTDTWVEPWNRQNVAKKRLTGYAVNDPVAMDLALRQMEEERAEKGENWWLTLSIGGDRLLYHDRYASRPIAPGGSDSYTVWLRFGDASDPLAPAKEALQAYGKAHPMKFSWPDRRPIVPTMIGDAFPYHEPEGPEMKKPAPGPRADEVRKLMLQNADQLIAQMKKINAQGMIVWNIEGNGPNYLKYVGDPRMVEFMCPEADAVADEFFKKFRDAGFKVGVCLRPSVIEICESAKNPDIKAYFPNAKSAFAYFHDYPHRKRSPADILSEKVEYAKKRWGCTLFYVDTNNGAGFQPASEAEKAAWPKNPDGSLQWYHALLNEDVWIEVLKRHPDVLFVIEHTPLIQYTVNAPYDGLDTKFDGTPAVVRATWPAAFKCLVISEGKHFWRAVEDARNGDVLFGGGDFVELACVAAECLKSGPPPELAKLDAAGLLAVASDPTAGERSRFHAAKTLCAAGLDAAAADALLKSPDKIVALMALDSLATADQLKAQIPNLARLMGNQGQYGFYAGAIREAIARGGPGAVLPALAEYARNTPADAAKVIGIFYMTTGPVATEQLAAVVRDASLPDGTRSAAAESLGWRKDATPAQKDAALDFLLPRLDDPDARLSAAGILHVRFAWEHGLWHKDPRVLEAAKTALAAEKARPEPDKAFVALLEKIVNRQQ